MENLKSSVIIQGDIITPQTHLIDTQELEDVLSLLNDEDMIEYLKRKYIDNYSQSEYFYFMGKHPHMTIEEFIKKEYITINWKRREGIRWQLKKEF